jgi:hypothetical protein
MYVDPD